jgi:hypothetical protein
VSTIDAESKLTLRSSLLYLLCSPWDCTVALLSVSLRLLGVSHARWSADSWLYRRWRYSTTLGHLVLLQPGCAGSETERHELVHVRQFEGAVCSVWLAALAGLAAGALAGFEVALLVVLLLGPWWSYAGASLAACLRGGRPYLDNHFELHARAATAPPRDIA